MSVLKNLLGNGAEQQKILIEMQGILLAVQEERDRNEKIVERVNGAIDRLEQIGEPVERAGNEIDAVSVRLAELEQRFAVIAKLAEHCESVAERAQGLTQDQEKTGEAIAEMREHAGQVASTYGQIGERLEAALSLQERLHAFLEVDKPFQLLRGDAETIRTQLESTHEQLARLRDAQDRLVVDYKTSISRMEALDRRREELGRDLTDKERRVAASEQAVRHMDGISEQVEDVRRQIGTLKALGDYVAQKTAGLEAQREAIESTATRADNLDRTMRQIDSGMRQVEEYERRLTGAQEQIAALQKLGDAVVDRSREIAQLQRQADNEVQSTRQELSSLRGEMKSTHEKFEFETKGLESVQQRVTDLRTVCADLENRYKGVNEASTVAGELPAQVESLSLQIATVGEAVGKTEVELARLQAIRRQLDESERVVREVGVQATRIEQSRPAIEVALRDVEQLAGVHAQVKDALEQTQVVNGEIGRLREGYAETRTWIAGVEQSVTELKDQAQELKKVGPMIEAAQKRADRLQDSIAVLDARKEYFDQLDRRVSELGAISSRLDERSRQLHSRVEVSEQQLTSLTVRAEEAEQLAKTMNSVSSAVQESVQETQGLVKSVLAIEERCGSVEGIAERTRALGQEIEQRQHALEQAAKDLKQASKLRQQAATGVQQLDEQLERVSAAITAANGQVAEVDALAAGLEDRTNALQKVDHTLSAFEERMDKWSIVDQEIARTLEQINSRQSTIESLRADLERMFSVAEKTATDVRAITTSQREISDMRILLEDHRGRLREIRETASALDERQRQMSRAEERLARSEALLADVRGSLETLQGQKVLVDQAVEKAGSLRFLLKQAEAMIDGLREERKMTADVRSAVGLVADEIETEIQAVNGEVALADEATPPEAEPSEN